MKILIRSQHASIMYHAKNKLLNEVYKSSFDSRDTLSTIAMVRKQMVTIVDRNQCIISSTISTIQWKSSFIGGAV
jgi:hypothetical protein